MQLPLELQPAISATCSAMLTPWTPETFEKISLSFAAQKLHSFEGKAEHRAFATKWPINLQSPRSCTSSHCLGWVYGAADWVYAAGPASSSTDYEMRNNELGSKMMKIHDYIVQMLISLYTEALTGVGSVVNNQDRAGPQGG